MDMNAFHESHLKGRARRRCGAGVGGDHMLIRTISLRWCALRSRLKENMEVSHKSQLEGRGDGAGATPGGDDRLTRTIRCLWFNESTGSPRRVEGSPRMQSSVSCEPW